MRAFHAATALIAVAAVVCGVPALAQGQTSEPAVQVVPVLTDATRVESWSYFEPFEGDPDYTLIGNRATLGVATATRHFEGYGAFQYAQLLNLPRAAMTGRVLPTVLGPGGYYYDAARAPNAYQLYFKSLSLRVRNLGHGFSFEFGRMTFESAAEARSASPALTALVRDRLHGRLLGEVGWSAFERTFDGVRVDVAQPRWHANAALMFPSQGAYEESANATMSGVRVATASVTFWNSPAPRPDVGPIARLAERSRVHESAAAESSSFAYEAQLFAQQYRDVRAGKTPPDNAFRPSAIQTDISVASFGGSLVSLLPAGNGRFDALVWFAGQTGHWYSTRHRALSVIAEGGYRWTPWPLRPWVRGGLTYASGDDTFLDDTHQTFFPGLPSSQPSLLAGVYAQMNLRDVFGELRLEPARRLSVRASVHRLSLPSGNDRWYSGTGATAIRGDFFGFSGRMAFQRTDLATLLQTSVDTELTKQWTLRGSFGLAKAGAAGRIGFIDDRLTVFAFENLLTF